MLAVVSLVLATVLLPSAWAQATPISPDYEGNCEAPMWSSDGTQLSWEVNFHDRKVIDLYVMAFGSGSGPRKVVPVVRGASAMTAGFDVAAAQDVVHEITFSPPSLHRFIYSASGASEDYDLYMDGGGAIAAAPGADGNAAWSPDGRHIVFTSARTGQGDLYLLDVNSLEAPPLKLSGDAVATEIYAAWAPDSQHLAFVGHTRQGDNLYIIDNVGFPAPRQFTSWEHTQTHPTWSPDGTMIAFYSNHTDIHRFDLYMAPVNGTPTLVAQDVVMNGAGPAWTPDGRHLIYVKHDDNRYNPVYAAPVRQPSQAQPVATGTVGNADLSVAKRSDGKVWLAVAAQGRTGDRVRDFRKVYVMALGALP